MSSLNDEILKAAQVTLKSGAILTIGRIISTLISFITMIFVIKFLGEEQFGLYGLVLIPINIIMLFRDWGVPPALTKYIAWLRTKKRIYEMEKLILSAFIFVIFTSACLTILVCILAKPIAVFYRKPEVAQLIKVVSLVLLAGALYNVAWNVFLGFEDTKYNVAMLIVNSAVKGGLALALVLLGYGVFGAIIGYVIGYFAAGFLGIVFIPREILKYKEFSYEPPVPNEELNWKSTLSILLGFGFPLAVASIVSGFGNQFYSFLAGRYCSKWDFGNYSAANMLLSPLPVLTMPILTVMFPAYSKIDGVKERDLLDAAFKLAVKYIALLIVPVTALIIGLSDPLKTVIFGSSFPDASFYLMLLAAIYLFTPLGYLSFGPLLRGQGRTKIILMSNLLSLMIGIPVSLILIPSLGIIGLILTNIVARIAIVAFNSVIVKMEFKVGIELASSIRILLAGVSSVFTAYFLQMLINSYAIVELLIGGLAGLSVYVVIILVSGALTMEDIHNLRVIFRGIRPIRRVLKPHAKKIEEILKKVLE